MKTALVSGCAGFVGRHITRRLLNDGWEVTGVDNLIVGEHPEWIKLRACDHFSFYKGDIRQFVKMVSCPYDLVVHCAAVVGGRLKIEGDPIGVATDLAIDSDLMNWLVRLKPLPKRAVYFSSSAAYPVELQTRQTHVKLHEQMIDFKSRIGVPDATYGWSKLTGEFLARHAALKYGLPVAIYRPFSGYGEDQDLSYPFPALMQRLFSAPRSMFIWGSGEQSRDFVHIDDVVECVMMTMEQIIPGEALNIGSGAGISFMDLVKDMACVCKLPLPELRPDTSKPEGVFYRVADTYNMEKLFKPKISLREGIQRVYEYQKQHLDRLAPVA